MFFAIGHLRYRSIYNYEWMQTAHYLKAVHQSLRNTVPWFIYLPSSQNKLKHILPPCLVVLREQLPVPQTSIVLVSQVLPLSLPPKELFKDPNYNFLSLLKLHTSIIGCCKKKDGTQFIKKNLNPHPLLNCNKSKWEWRRAGLQAFCHVHSSLRVFEEWSLLLWQPEVHAKIFGDIQDSTQVKLHSSTVIWENL